MNLDFYLQPGERDWRHIARRVSQILPLHEQAETEDAISRGLFYPGTPILRNAGGPLNMASCHSWVVPDSIEGIFEAVKVAGIVFKSGGGGIGLDLSKLRAAKAPLRYVVRDIDTAAFGQAGGPLGFWPLFMAASVVVGPWKSGKPSGSMGTLNWAHPDARAWASCKRQDGRFNESNLTITVDDWSALSLDDRMFIAENAHHNGTPGVAFLDNINAHNPEPDMCGRMTTLNVCSEVPGWHATICVLSSVALPMAVQRIGDYDELRRAVRLQVRLLDRVLDVNHYPHPAFKQQAQLVRQIGAGVMGWADLLRREGIPYASPACNQLAGEIGGVVSAAARAASWELAHEKGGYAPGKPRNAIRLALAPNGHLAPLAELAPSICLDFNDSAQYRKSLDLTPEQHVRHIAAWAEWVDGGISYTLPLRNDSSVGDVLAAFDLAHSLGVKALAVYRDDSRENQPCSADGTCAL